MSLVLGDGNSNPIEQELANSINGLAGQNYPEIPSKNRGNSSQETEMRDSNTENEIPRRDETYRIDGNLLKRSECETFPRNGLFDVPDVLPS